MGRIEYEYPLFKVYYSNNSNNSNIRGNPVHNCVYVQRSAGAWPGIAGRVMTLYTAAATAQHQHHNISHNGVAAVAQHHNKMCSNGSVGSPQYLVTVRGAKKVMQDI